jgi:hypothetical protein
MAEFLFVTPQEIASTTIMGGNVDVDKYIFCIANTQATVIEPLLGSLLYEKILEDAENDDLSGDYLILYNKYIKPITKYQSVAQYVEIGSIIVSNGGIFKHVADNSEIVTREELLSLSQQYRAFAQMYVQRFNRWICKNPISEYKNNQEDVLPNKDLKLTAGWKL